ncbi:KPN_02809 family neutral zinc metallopeptidase [Microbacterium sp.]|uniref:KPN_02809 family neutral zinc metallopeptidase n=1 Tax=Microbacterium sp. TaxID=51671 RepID=UPI003F6E710E
MTFNDNARVGGNRATRRGPGAGLVGGGIAGIGGLVILLFSLFTGGDLSGLLGGGIPEADQYWADNVQDYREPNLVIVDGSTPTQCGTASNQTGPFYCPPEETVYVDPTFFALLRQQFGATAGPLAQIYVLAHEYGHHIQNIAGIMQRYPNNGTGPDSNGVRTELQADCFAGAWVGSMTEQVDENGVPFLKAPTEVEIRDALDAAQTVGDDHIQQAAGQGVNPETWTHGSSEQRQRWFSTGYRDGYQACDTFAVSGSSL